MDRRLMNTSYIQSRLKHLHGLHRGTLHDYGEIVSSLNDECETLVDLIPSYKLREGALDDTQDGEKAPKLKKEVATIEKLETEILRQYEHFLSLLRKFQRKSHPEQQFIGSKLCAKLVRSSAHEFNKNDVLLRLAIDFANSKVARVAFPVLQALQELLDGEMVSEATELVVSAILALVRQKHHAINPKVLNLLLFIRPAMLDIHRADIAEQKEKNKKMKERNKEVARQMMKGQARRDRAQLAAKQTAIIHKVFVVYLRVLQGSKTCSKQHQARVLAPTLEGLAKFAPLVNLEHMQLLMTALRELLANEEGTTVATRLHALVAVACLAQKDAASFDDAQWRVDLAEFHTVLFRCIPAALTCPPTHKLSEDEEEGEKQSADTRSVGSAATTGTLSSQAFSIAQSMAQAQLLGNGSVMKEWTHLVSVLIRAIDLQLLAQRHVPTTRITAFVRRLAQFIPLVPPHIAVSLMAVVHRLVRQYSSCGTVIVGGSDLQGGGGGAYNPNASDPAMMHAEASFTWELPLLRQSFHPEVRRTVQMLLKACSEGDLTAKNVALDQSSPYDLLQWLDCSEGEIQPPPPQPRASRKRPRSTA